VICSSPVLSAYIVTSVVLGGFQYKKGETTTRGDFRNSLTYIINPRITDIAIATPTAISIPDVRDPKKI
jgi:hypothetical protein